MRIIWGATQCFIFIAALFGIFSFFEYIHDDSKTLMDLHREIEESKVDGTYSSTLTSQIRALIPQADTPTNLYGGYLKLLAEKTSEPYPLNKQGGMITCVDDKRNRYALTVPHELPFVTEIAFSHDGLATAKVPTQAASKARGHTFNNVFPLIKDAIKHLRKVCATQTQLFALSQGAAYPFYSGLDHVAFTVPSPDSMPNADFRASFDASGKLTRFELNANMPLLKNDRDPSEIAKIVHDRMKVPGSSLHRL